jgi:hypothetical protein
MEGVFINTVQVLSTMVNGSKIANQALACISMAEVRSIREAGLMARSTVKAPITIATVIGTLETGSRIDVTVTEYCNTLRVQSTTENGLMIRQPIRDKLSMPIRTSTKDYF